MEVGRQPRPEERGGRTCNPRPRGALGGQRHLAWGGGRIWPLAPPGGGRGANCLGRSVKSANPANGALSCGLGVKVLGPEACREGRH